MEQDVETSYRPVCSTCLSTDRNLYAITGMPQVYQMFRLLMYDFAGERLEDADIEQYLCWECLALMRRLVRFKLQAQSAQEHLRVLALSGTNEGLDHTYLSQTLSTLETQHKVDYDRIYFDYTTNEEWAPQYISITPRSVKDEQYDVGQVVAEDISFQIENHVLEVPTATLDGTVAGSLISHIVVGPDGVVSTEDLHVKGEMPELIVSPILTHRAKDTTILISQEDAPKMSEFKKENDVKCGYNVDLMTEEELQASREAAKEQVHYASSVYKCELCIVGFYTHQQVEDHFVSLHKQKLGTTACKICCVYIEDAKLSDHIASHYTRYTCKHCGHVETSSKLIALHVNRHIVKQKVPNNVVHIGDATASVTKDRKKKAKKETPKTPPKPGDLRKLLSKTTVELYKCLECEMFFKTSRARKNHVARVHREGLQCDRCKKRFVNRTTLATHLRLHEGPLPREECPICHKMVRVIQLKYHIQRHQNKSRYPCTDCNKVFSHLATYQAHLKYSRAHATEQIFKFPCPMCNKGYPTKEAMQDHFNYQHLGKTSHKCPVCDKPIASRANVEKHMMRVHGEKKQKPRNYVCQQCGKSFTDKKALTQHIVIHSSDRPLVCDICRQTFKQKASLYTHRKRVHKIMPVRRELHYMNDQNSAGSE